MLSHIHFCIGQIHTHCSSKLEQQFHHCHIISQNGRKSNTKNWTKYKLGSWDDESRFTEMNLVIYIFQCGITSLNSSMTWSFIIGQKIKYKTVLKDDELRSNNMNLTILLHSGKWQHWSNMKICFLQYGITEYLSNVACPIPYYQYTLTWAIFYFFWRII